MSGYLNNKFVDHSTDPAQLVVRGVGQIIDSWDFPTNKVSVHISCTFSRTVKFSLVAK